MGNKQYTKMPIQSAKDVANKYGQDIVMLVAWDSKTGYTHTVTYGRTKQHCEWAAILMNNFRCQTGIMEKLPARIVRQENSEITNLKALLNNAYDAMNPNKNPDETGEQRRSLWNQTYEEIGRVLGRAGSASSPNNETKE